MSFVRSRSPATVVAIAFVAFAACSSQGGSTSPSSAPSSTPSPAGAKQNLVFTGPAAGTLTEATTQCEVFTAQSQLNFALRGTLGGQDLVLNIHVSSGYHGPGSYPVGSLLDGAGELRLQAGSYAGASSTGAGTLIISPDGKSGSIEADLSGGEHVKGNFRCDDVQTQSSA
jgi:hypothetical protein